MKKLIFFLARFIGVMLGTFFSIFFLSFIVFAWTGPQHTPPTCLEGEIGCEEVIHTGSSAQSKVGGLFLNTGGAINGLIVDKGNVGIGTITPVTKLEINGMLKINYEDVDCNSSLTGTIRYNPNNNSLEFCDGSYWNVFAVGRYQLTNYGSYYAFGGGVPDVLIEYPENLIEMSGTYFLRHGTANINTELYEFDGGVYDSTNYCDLTPDDTMCMVRYNGDTILNGTHTTATRKKGLVLYINGNLTLNGGLTMTARGANAEGQDIQVASDFLVSSVGGSGGIGSNSQYYQRNPGGPGGVKADSSGGGGGGGSFGNDDWRGYGGDGSAGTSYSGGAGGGGGWNSTHPSYAYGSDGGINGGAGGSANGVGNPSGGTGGLLIVYVNGDINGSGSITSNGTAATGESGGGSGGGVVVVRYSGDNNFSGSVTATGGAGGPNAQYSAYGGAGGNGTTNIAKISS